MVDAYFLNASSLVSPPRAIPVAAVRMADAAIIVFSFIIACATVATIQQQSAKAAEWYRSREAGCQNDSELVLVQESTAALKRNSFTLLARRLLRMLFAGIFGSTAS
jgi:hypothetical protein